MRGIAAILVVMYHQQFGETYRLPIEVQFFKQSYLMVDLFFILSGFIMSYVYKAELRLNLDQAREFWWARFTRIYPLHVFALLSLTAFHLFTMALLHVAGRDVPEFGSMTDWIRQLLLLNAWFPWETGWNIPSWSISAELVAYAIFPAALLLQSYSRTALQLFILAISLVFYGIFFNNLDITSVWAPIRCLAGFGLGIIIYYHRDWVSKIKHLSAWQLICVAWAVIVMSIPLSDSLVIPAFVGIVLLTWSDEGIVSRFLSGPTLHRLGELSYSVYLMHFLAGAIVWFGWVRLDNHVDLPDAISRSAYLIAVYVLVIFFSVLTYTYIEKPSQNLLRRWRYARSAVSAPAL
jgi:peptidoglycan/LPS O-acetylase OafA/YrhL